MQISVRRSLGWMMASQGGMFMLQFGGSVIIARLLNPREMGVFAVGSAIVGMLGAIRAVGLSRFLIREAALDNPIIVTAFTVNAALAILTAAVTLALSGLGASLLRDPEVQRVLVILALIPLVGTFDFLPGAMVERAGDFRTLAVVNLVRAAVAAGATVVLAAEGLSSMSMAWGNLAASLAAALCLNVAGRRHVSLRLGLRDWRRITRFGVQMLTIGLSGNLASRLSELVLARVVGLAALGLYSRAAGLNGLLSENLHLVIARVVFVDFAEHRRRGLSLRDSYLRIVALITGLLWPAFGGLAIISEPLIRTIYGTRWTGAALPLSLLSIASGVLVAITMTGEIYTVCGQTRAQVRYELKRSGTGLALFIAGCFGGLAGAAASRIAEAGCAIAYSRTDLNGMTQVTTADLGPIYLQSLLLALVACAPVGILMTVGGWSAKTPFSAVIGAVVAGAVLWLAALCVLHHPLFIELRAIYARLRSGSRPAT